MSLIRAIGSLVRGVFKPASVQYPLPCNGDSIYDKNIDTDVSDNGDFSGEVTGYFNSLISISENTTTDNPKIIKVWFARTVYAHSIGLGCNDLSKNFGNSITLELLGSGEVVRKTVNSTGDVNSRLIEFGPAAFNGFNLKFNTAADVCLSNITIQQSIQTTATIQGTTPTGDVLEANVTDDGDLSISDNSSGLAIAEGNVTGKTFIHKFGEAPDFDSGDGSVTIWDGADDSLFAALPPMNITYSTTADTGTISSSNIGDTVDIEIQGLDANKEVVVQTITLNGQTDVSLPTDLIRAFRMKNVGSTDLVGVVYLRVNGTAQTAGVPNNASDVRAIINNGNNQTLMSIYTIPAGKTGYMRDFYADIVGANKVSNYKVKLLARPEGQVFQVKHVKGLSESGTSSVQHDYNEPEVFEEKTDIELRVETTDSPITGANISGGFDIVLEDN